MKKLIGILLSAMLALSMLLGCGGETSPADETTTAPEETEAPRTGIPNSPAEYGLEVAEQAVVQTALAYYYANPYSQYDHGKRIAHDKSAMTTSLVAPEYAGPDRNYYAVCRSLPNDVYYNALGYEMGTGAKGSFSGNAGLVKSYFMQYSKKYGTPYQISVDEDRFFSDVDEFIAAYQESARPGDVLLLNQGDNAHVVMWLGDIYETGTNYVIHQWPVNGGTTDINTGENKMEPATGTSLQKADDVLLGKGSPSYTFKSCVAIIVIRPLQDPGVFYEHAITDSARTRLAFPFMSVRKVISEPLTRELVAGDELTVTITIGSEYGEIFRGMKLIEKAPAGTTFVEGSAKADEETGDALIDGDTFTWEGYVAPQTKTEISYKVRVNDDVQAGDDILFAAGEVTDGKTSLPTREVNYKAADAHLTEAETAGIAACESFDPAGATDLAAVKAYYKKAAGMTLNLPDTVQEFLDEISITEKKADLTETLVVPKTYEEMSDAGKAYWNSIIEKNLLGWYVYRPDLLRNLDFMESMFKVGDFFIIVKDPSKQQVINLRSLEFYVYLGNHKALVIYGNGENEVLSFDETFGRCFFLNTQSIVIGIHPSAAQ